ncbi:hypothetical protein C7974DRAFT_399121 [Boeremia exigua]|uniref:uncharacterized protein n=1 Tax=Boeremia exigua TaxID=749465 RepID=UPI001E8D5C80|nr:uncharacterized protein C7974DRAFT_399121 [Boeremia exigua]KAH6620209.1 hypothetical protein C7974DRAFT_399121 [Boeremia exigua]
MNGSQRNTHEWNAPKPHTGQYHTDPLSLSNISTLAEYLHMSRQTLRSQSRDFIVILLRSSARDSFSEIETNIERRYPRIAESIRAVVRDATNMSGINSSEELLELVRNTCKNEIQSGLDKGFSKLMEEFRTQTRDSQLGIAQSSTENAPQNVGIVEVTEEFTARNRSLEGEVQRLKDTLEQTKQAVARQLRDNEAKTTKLRKIIIENGLDNDGPIDQEVENTFSTLSHNIFKFVKNHCTNETARNPSWYRKVPSDVQNWWVVRQIANCLYIHLFAPGRSYFGFLDPHDDNLLATFHMSLEKDVKVPAQEMLDWRIRTCQLSKYSNPSTRLSESKCEELVSLLYQRLEPFWHHSSSDMRKKFKDIRLSLADLCQQAFRIVMLFRRAKTEYRWLQMDREMFRDPILLEEQVEVQASAGFTSFENAQRVEEGFKTVFGEVIKGDGPSGRVKESWQILRKCSVLLLGPGHVCTR